eukprot:GILJ01013375.1.p2 GENE.GILJ01013375.1~~GILJ01013375.1.p2  ORF type:complete len:180 (+),score=16.65 GILJ01013375.1:361-900(+)
MVDRLLLHLQTADHINSEDKLGHTPLVTAVTSPQCCTESIPWLLAYGADVNKLEALGKAQSFRWFQTQFCRALEYLLDCGADVNNLFHLASKWGGSLALDIIVANTCPFVVDPRDEAGNTPLLNALHRNNSDMALWLIERGADPTATYYRGLNALGLAGNTNARPDVMRAIQLAARKHK